MARLELAQRGADLLERKRGSLMRELARCREEAEQARRAWDDAAAQIAEWGDRAARLDGTGRLELLAGYVQQPASCEVAWRNVMGADIPAVVSISIPDLPPLSALGGSSASVLLARAAAEATRAAAQQAATQRAEAEVSAELARAVRRLRALRDRWIPRHEEALAQLDLALDESQREQAARVLWLTRRAPPSPRRQPGPAR